MNCPKISVVIPNYNHAAYLPQRIDSILNQTFQDIEIIILDDCSTDHSLNIIESYTKKYPTIRIHFNQQNSGSPFAQWNKGVAMARGEYIWIAESDDYASPQFLETLIKPLNNHSNIGLAYCQSTVVNRVGQVIGTAQEWTNDLNRQRWTKEFINQGTRECQYLLYKNTVPNASAVLFRKTTFLEIGGADPSMKMVGDWLVWMKMLLVVDIYFHPASLNYFRTHSTTTREITQPNKIVQKAKEEYKILRYGLDHILLKEQEKERILQSVFNRIANSFPLRLILSPYVRDFLIIARSVDSAVVKRVISYIPIVCKRIWSHWQLSAKEKSYNSNIIV